MHDRRLLWIYTFSMLVGCGTATPAPTPSGASSSAAPDPWVRAVDVEATTTAREPKVPVETQACAADKALPEKLACDVFRALRTEDADAYVALHVMERVDVEALATLMSHAPTPPSDEQIAKRRVRMAERFQKFVATLLERGLAPGDLELVEVDTHRAQRKGDQGFAEDLTIDVRSNDKTLRITIDDCPYVRGRWMIMDGLKLRDP